MVRIGVALAVVAALGGVAQAQSPVERGKYLFDSVAACGNCHTMQGPQGPDLSRDLAGGLKFDEPFGVAYAPNITPDPETGIGKWTDAQIITAIRDGKRPDGSLIGPPMPIPLYRGISDEDARAMVAYLRTVKPVVNKVPRSQYKGPLPPNYGPPVGNVASVPRTDKVKYGAYLAGPVAHCTECHSTPGPHGAPDFVNHEGAGGMEFKGPWGVSVAPNITPTGLKDWSDADIKKAITQGVRPDGRRLKPPMGFYYYKNTSAADLDAIVAYLRAMPAK
jgi:cytochrome c553